MVWLNNGAVCKKAISNSISICNR